jgi:hypothetical protein
MLIINDPGGMWLTGKWCILYLESVPAMTMSHQAPSITAGLEYVSPHCKVYRRFVCPAREVNTGRCEEHKVTIRNARLAEEKLSLETSGFCMVRHDTKVTDFYDQVQVDKIYPGEIKELLKDLTGADLVLDLGTTLRSSRNPRGNIQPPGREAHVDYNEASSHRLARRMLEENGMGDYEYHRFMAINLWRVISDPPQDWPLALCDGRSVGREDGVGNVMVRVDEIPDMETMLTMDVPGEDQLPTAFLFLHNPEHRWYYYPDMTPEELLVFKLYDSAETGAWRVPHGSFRDPAYPDAGGRESAEIRTVAYFK